MRTIPSQHGLRVARGMGWIAAAAWLLAGLAGCGRRAPEGGASGAHAAHRGGTVVIALVVEPEALMPYGPPNTQTTNVLSLLLMPLASTDSTLVTFSPALAKSWDWSPDHKSLTMHLHDDAWWTDGVRVTAEDVQFSWEIARDSVVAWSTRSWKQAVKRCIVVDPFTVRFEFDSVCSDQFRNAKEGFVIPKHLLMDVPRAHWAAAEFGRHPIGCGPFVLESWEPQQRIVLARNEKYFEKGRPYLDRVVFQIVPETASRVAQLRAGQLDLVEDLPARDAADLRAAMRAGTSPLRVISCRARYYDFIGYNLREPLFASPKVRQALTRAIDRKAIIESQFYGFAELFESPVVPIQWAYNPQQPITPYDPAGARRLLAEEGWQDHDGDGWLDKDGKRFEFALMMAGDNQQRLDAAVPVLSYWKAVGVQAHVQTLEKQVALDLRNKKQFQAYYGGWSAALTPNLQNVWGCDRIEKGLNFVSYCNPRVDSLNAAALCQDVEKARPLFYEAQRLVARDHPYTWMYYAHQVVGLHERVHGAIIDLRGPYNNPEEWWVSEERKTGR